MSDEVAGNQITGHGAKTCPQTPAASEPIVAGSASVDVKEGICVQASPLNTASSIVYVGKTGMTAANAGVMLLPGQAVTIPTDDPSTIYVLGSAAGLEARWMAV